MSEAFDEDELYRWPAAEKWEYRSAFYNLDGELDALPREDFYAVAKASVERLATGQTLAEIEGMAALFLFRHYLELSLKGVVFGARSLERKDKNTPPGTAQWPTGHDLWQLWSEARKQVPLKLGSGVWMQWDHAFVEKCIEEFQTLDPSSERLRYRREKKPVERDRFNPLRVEWGDLLRVMEHTHSVLEAIDSYLVETYGQNADWKAEMDSWV